MSPRTVTPIVTDGPVLLPAPALPPLATQLTPKLKALNLGGMLQTLSLRLDQAQQQRLGYTEFLELLLGDEIERRGNRSLASRIARARFEEPDKTFESFDWAFNPTLPQAQLRDLATGGYLVRKEHILLCGPVGVGKTHLASAFGHQACRQGQHVLFTKTVRLLADLGGGHADGTWEARLRRYLQPQLLILDDFALREFTPQQAEDLYELIGERTRSGSLILTSNRAPTDWYGVFPNPVLAEGALDRLLGRAHQLELTGRSYRPQQRPDRRLDPAAARPPKEPTTHA
jgi:DNA replication protein DnaC